MGLDRLEVHRQRGAGVHVWMLTRCRVRAYCFAGVSCARIRRLRCAALLRRAVEAPDATAGSDNLSLPAPSRAEKGCIRRRRARARAPRTGPAAVAQETIAHGPR